VKVLLPMACVILLGAALWQLMVPEMSSPKGTPIPWLDYNPFDIRDWSDAKGAFVVQIILAVVGLAICGAVVAWVLYAAATGRNLKQRLTDPAPIAEPEPA
jgi:hypothetical protein